MGSELRLAVHTWLAAAVLMLGASTAFAEESQGVAAEAPTQQAGVEDERLEKARSIVALAEPLFVAGHYAAALAEYTRAYQILEGHPRQYWVLHNMALCNERLYRYDVAFELYTQYLARAPATEPDRAEVTAILQTLDRLLGTLVVETRVSGELWLDDRRLGTAPGRWRIPAGRHIVELRAPLYEAERRELQVQPPDVQTLHFELRRLAAERGPSPGFFWAATVASGAAAVAGMTFGFLALESHSEGADRAEAHLDTSEQADRARRQALAADICFGTAVVFAGAATALYFVTDWSGGAESGTPAHKPAAARKAGVALGALGSPGATLHLEF